MSACPPICINPARTSLIFMKFNIEHLLKFAETIQVWLKSGKPFGQFT
jgi:hypothetical protein